MVRHWGGKLATGGSVVKRNQWRVAACCEGVGCGSVVPEMTDWNLERAEQSLRWGRDLARPLLAAWRSWRRVGFSRWVLGLAGMWTWIMGGVAVSVAAETGSNVPAYVVKSWRTLDGLPQNSVTAMAQTPEGYLWVGTRGGLARFDGVHFRNYGLADGLRGLSIRALLEDGQGGLWIATRGGGLSRWRNGVISTLTTADGLAHEDVLSLAPAEPGAV